LRRRRASFLTGITNDTRGAPGVAVMSGRA
jgi:hypothetical protein